MTPFVLIEWPKMKLSLYYAYTRNVSTVPLQNRSSELYWHAFTLASSILSDNASFPFSIIQNETFQLNGRVMGGLN